MSGASNAVPLMGRIYDLDELIRRLVSKEPLDDMVAEPLSAADVEENLHPPREDKKVIVGGYYRTKGGYKCCIFMLRQDGLYVGVVWQGDGDSGLATELFLIDGNARFTRLYDLDLSTYQPQPFEE